MRCIDRKKVGFRSLIDANLEGKVGVNKFKLYKDQVLLYNAIKGCCFFNFAFAYHIYYNKDVHIP